MCIKNIQKRVLFGFRVVSPGFSAGYGKKQTRDENNFHRASNPHSLLFGRSARRLCDGIAHRSICFDIFHSIIIHNTEISRSECLRHSPGHFRLGFDDFGTGLLRFGFHFLFESDSHGPTLFGLCLRDILVGLSLNDLQSSTDDLTYIYIGDINRE